MKVLLVFPQQDGQTGLFIKKSFVQLGCDVRVVDAKVEPQITFSVANSFQPDLIFCSRTIELISQIQAVRTFLPNTKIVCWNVDKRDDVREFGSQLFQLFGMMDILYTVGLGNVGDYERLLPNITVKHLQQGCDPETHHREDLTIEDRERYGCDVVFAGSVDQYNHTNRGELIRFLSGRSEFDLGIYSDEYNTFITDSEHNKACQCAKIVLGHNGWPNVPVSMSVRDYKIMGAGGFLLTEYCQGIEDWFRIGDECAVYTSKELCLSMIMHYLENENERKRVADTGFQTVHRNHKYVDRIKVVINDMEMR